MTERSHPIDALHDAISGRLSLDQRAALDAHLAECDAFRREFEAMAWVAGQIAAAPDVPVPVDLEAGLLRALDAEDAATAGPQARARMDRRSWLLLAGSAAAAAGAAALGVWRFLTADGDLPSTIAADLRAYASGRLPLDVRTDVPDVLDAYLRASRLTFESEVFDFGAMNYRLDGGGVHAVGGRPSALFAYRGPGERRMVCQMYPGLASELPAPDDRRVSGGVEFLVYDEDDVAVVFWQDGPVVCVIAMNGDLETAITFAIAKAVPA